MIFYFLDFKQKPITNYEFKSLAMLLKFYNSIPQREKEDLFYIEQYNPTNEHITVLLTDVLDAFERGENPEDLTFF